MTFQSAIGAGVVCLVLTGCIAPGYYYDSGPSYSASSSSSGASYSEPSSSYGESPAGYDRREQSYVDSSGNIVFREPGETTIVRPDGDVTVIQRDADGTRTIVGSDGSVQVRTPDGNCIGDGC